MYLRNFLAAASLIAMVAFAALPETQRAYVPGFEKSCVEGCKAFNAVASSQTHRPNLGTTRETFHGKTLADVDCTGELLRMVPSV